jgi:hypothetical protein
MPVQPCARGWSNRGDRQPKPRAVFRGSSFTFSPSTLFTCNIPVLLHCPPLRYTTVQNPCYRTRIYLYPSPHDPPVSRIEAALEFLCPKTPQLADSCMRSPTFPNPTFELPQAAFIDWTRYSDRCRGFALSNLSLWPPKPPRSRIPSWA